MQENSCFIKTKIKAVRIENNFIYVRCQKYKETNYPEVVFISSFNGFYVPKIDDIVKLYMPSNSIDIKYCFATIIGEKIEEISSGEAQVGILQSFINFLKSKLEIKHNTTSITLDDKIEIKNSLQSFKSLVDELMIVNLQLITTLKALQVVESPSKNLPITTDTLNALQVVETSFNALNIKFNQLLK